MAVAAVAALVIGEALLLLGFMIFFFRFMVPLLIAHWLLIFAVVGGLGHIMMGNWY
jgi:hypothetical protein